ncbi:MAG TPA: hypothetical protein VFX49_04040, partial [Chloroflexota bacterium]|nr:hypothetical protein [Chloroflexota bacterium]
MPLRMGLVWAATSGLVGVVLEALRHPEGGPAGALAAGLTWALGAAALAALAEVALAPLGVRWATRVRPAGVERLSGAQIALSGGGLIALALARTPHRMAANLIGYALAAGVLVWLGQRRAAARGARAAGLAVALLGLVPAHLNVTTAPALPAGAAGSPHVWSAGWPSG